ncbi:hypothetical protein GUITHDRAFT_122571 [Guillardia theta CCMP2712]|uniref:Uncharacterized protein n=1 Tax=Guillardia theta (strain CCMP2712) TaxID=905079 RepID=L1I4Q3_GUITC|nr:hypothetical protein GUITHDRAFT_122571 [Guillardia theta CCMP2712]EKX31226.1 hypothetical protein GUITHDRAFT_122571 [Guillardia theta CCMP2712]|eukprot:XP_005818206.1 hypothetical protein GUITHDRAFT_122571 [Guillardia theta CCMP2712]
MNPLIVKFNRINLENSCLSDVKDIIFDRYMELCKSEIEEFNNANFMCEMCCSWTPSEECNRLSACKTCTDNYFVWRCSTCDDVFEHLDAMETAVCRDGRLIKERHCKRCEAELELSCWDCGMVYKLCNGYDEEYCSYGCKSRNAWL